MINALGVEKQLNEHNKSFKLRPPLRCGHLTQTLGLHRIRMLLKYFTVTNVVGLFSMGMFSIAIFAFYSSYTASSWPSTEGHISYSDARKLGGSTEKQGSESNCF